MEIYGWNVNAKSATLNRTPLKPESITKGIAVTVPENAQGFTLKMAS